MANTSDIRNGMIIRFKHGLYEIVEFLHVKPGKGAAFVRTKLKNIKTGQVIDNTFRTSEKLDDVRVEASKKEYLYFDGTFHVFMDNETYEQINVPVEAVGDMVHFLVPNIEVKMKFSPEGEILGMDFPSSVEMEIVECEPNIKGATASGSGKKATTDTGLNLIIPAFIEIGNRIKVDTRSGEYQERL